MTGMALVFWIFMGSWLVQMVYFGGVFFKFVTYQYRKGQEQLPPVSIIVSARNEAENLLRYIPLLLNQHYPEFELVLVDDRSYDNTWDVIKAFESKSSVVRGVQIKDMDSFPQGKKFALTLGIKAAKNDLLVFTDADCSPADEHWLSKMVQSFSDETMVTIGYGAFNRSPGWLNKLIRFDGFFIGLQYLSFAMAGLPYMGVGRNLAYRKSAFFEEKGFSSHQNIPSGDDDLFVNSIANNSNVAIAPFQAHTYTIAKQSFWEWVHQKRRHITTSVHYRMRDQLLLGMFSLSQILFWTLFLVLIIGGHQIYWVLGLFGCRFLIQIFTFNAAMRKLGEQDLLWYTPMLELALVVFYPILGLSNLLFRQHNWRK